MPYQSVLIRGESKIEIEYGYSQAARPIFSIAEGSQQLKRGQERASALSKEKPYSFLSSWSADSKWSGEAPLLFSSRWHGWISYILFLLLPSRGHFIHRPWSLRWKWALAGWPSPFSLDDRPILRLGELLSRWIKLRSMPRCLSITSESRWGFHCCLR
jgi:hypothetical protein